MRYVHIIQVEGERYRLPFPMFNQFIYNSIMKYLSIYENDWEVREFLFQNGFITEDEKNDDEYDLLKWFEGDPDWIDIKQPGGYYDRIYFAMFIPFYDF